MTKREFFEAVVNGNVTDEVKGMAGELLEKMDAANSQKREKAAEKNAEKAAERAPWRAAIMAQLTTVPKTATVLLAESELDISLAMVSQLLRPLVESGEVVKSNVKVDKRTQVGYALAAAQG